MYQVKIPIPDYYGEEVFFYELYFNTVLTKELVIEYLNLLIERDSVYIEEYGNIVIEDKTDSLIAIENLEGDFPNCDGLRSTNEFTNIPKFGRQPIIVSKIHTMEDSFPSR